MMVDAMDTVSSGKARVPCQPFAISHQEVGVGLIGDLLLVGCERLAFATTPCNNVSAQSVTKQRYVGLANDGVPVGQYFCAINKKMKPI